MIPLSRFYTCIVLLCTMTAISAFGQSLHPQTRPLDGSPDVDLPAFESFEAYFQTRGLAAKSLKTQATVVDTAVWVMRPTTVESMVRVAGKTFVDSKVGLRRMIRSANGTVRWFEGTLSSSTPLAGKATSTEAFTSAAMSVLSENSRLLGLDDPEAELRPISTKIDRIGNAHARFEQTYRGVPVWGRDLYVHFNERGEMYALNGSYEPTPRDIEITPALSEGRAEDVVIRDLQDRERWAPLDEETEQMLDIERVASRLVLYPDPDRGVRLAYEVSVHPTLIEWYAYLVDAQSGEVLNRIEQHCSYFHDHALPDAKSLARSIPVSRAKASFVDAQGVDLAGVNQNFRVFSLDDGRFLKLSDLDNIASPTIRIPIPEQGGSAILTANNSDLNQETELNGIVSGNNQWNNPNSVSAHVNAAAVYNYFKSTFGRKAIDDKDQSLISIIHATEVGRPMDNAFWNGRFMVYGDGDQAFTPLAGGLDVAAHEMTHGVVQHTAGLVYQFQSGALNESFADVFGALLDPDDFLIGEDVMRPGVGAALRDLLNPNNPQVLSSQPASMAQYQNLSADQDNGGVHVNSGIPNRAAALIMQAVGNDKAGQIYYQALANYMTRNSQFGDARNAVEQAAVDLFGDGTEAQAVRQAFDAVGITTSSGSGGDDGNDIPVQTGGQSLIAFLLDDGSLGLVNMTDRNDITTGLFNSMGATARVNPELADYAQLTTTRTGEDIWFINDQRKLAFINVNSGEVSVFNDLSIQQDGDLWNASISPDGNFVTLVSAYENDPNLYIYDGQQLFTIELKPESSQDGIKVETVQYPDVVSWSPNPEVPRIAFDAFNVQPILESEDEEFWNIYEVDFSAGRIFELLPPQGSGFSVGNITHSNSDPDVIAINVLVDNEADIVVGNFSTGEFLGLDLPENGITDGLRPSFSPNDAELVFSSAANNQLVFSDGSSLSMLTFQEPLRNPRWFVAGGSGGTQNQAPAASFTASVVTGDAPLVVEFDASDSSDPEGGELTYRWEFGDGSTSGGETTTHTFAQSGSFEVILTILDSGGLSSSASLMIDVTTATPVESSTQLPNRIALHQNYPNPFIQSTQILYDLPAPSRVSIHITDLLGRIVSILVDGNAPAGYHQISFGRRRSALGYLSDLIKDLRSTIDSKNGVYALNNPASVRLWVYKISFLLVVYAPAMISPSGPMTGVQRRIKFIKTQLTRFENVPSVDQRF